MTTPHQLRDSLALYALLCATPPPLQSALLALLSLATTLPYLRGPDGVTPPALLPLLAGLAAELAERRLPQLTAAWSFPARSLGLALGACSLAVPDPARLVSCATTCAVLHAVLRHAGAGAGTSAGAEYVALPRLSLCVCAAAARLLRAWHKPPLSTRGVLDAWTRRETGLAPSFSPNVTAAETHAETHGQATLLYRLGVDLSEASEGDNDSTAGLGNRRTFLCRLFSGASVSGSDNGGTALALAPLWAAAVAAKVWLARDVGSTSRERRGRASPPPSACTDLAQLNLLPPQAGNGVLSRSSTATPTTGQYAVCIVDISAHAVTFRITNLVAGELIVLVNGLIWSEVACTLVLEHVGEEYVVVSGLVPGSAYDIQFVNRLEGNEDWVCADLALRTAQGETATPLAPFPSYYHRQFLSPLLTLQHSVLTTNTNLADERQKVKRTRREISKKTAALRQETASVRARLAQSGAAEEQGKARVGTLRLQAAQQEARVAQREAQLQEAGAELAACDDTYRQRKDGHLKLELELGKLRDPLRARLEAARERSGRAANEQAQLDARLARLQQRHAVLQRQWQEQEEALGKVAAQFVSNRERARVRREVHRVREANELEMELRGLQQDVSRLEEENEGMRVRA